MNFHLFLLGISFIKLAIRMIDPMVSLYTYPHLELIINTSTYSHYFDYRITVILKDMMYIIIISLIF
ncbi:hypothetical protein SAMN05216273_10181 [Chryseobacterium taihuense]|uniref:Uncharacterized protein n=1 Tax=Chryseobacterium taihuense TaxID=1141221 RepID=A0ABY0QP32_9FLAO|nr:hypothetical protein SAMN05216273_10181 [Chryseobacterium taihuense]